MFNLGGYLKNIFSAKNKDEGQQIETKLNEKNKKEEAPEELTEKQLQKDRKDTEETTIEKKLEKVRAGSQEMVTEGQLNKSKSTIIKQRNPETAKGNINKLEEKRLAGETMESEKQEPASEIDKPRRFWKTKSPDGLKLAKSIKIAQAVEDFDIEDVDDIPRGPEAIEDFDNFNVTPNLEEKLSREDIIELENILQQDVRDKETEEDKEMAEEESMDGIKKIKEDFINDPEVLNEVFSEEVIGQDESTGTMVEERQINFDLKDADGEIRRFFKKGKTDNIDKNVLKQAIINFININHVEDNIDLDSIQIDVDRFNFTGSATYIVPLS